MKIKIIFSACILVFTPLSYAQFDNDKTDFIWQQIRNPDIEQRAIDSLKSVPVDNTIVIAGETYSVDVSSLNDVKLAISYALKLKQWQDVEKFLSIYQAMAEHEAAWVIYTQGQLARQARDYAKAQQLLEQAVQADSSLVVAKLELARVQAENYQFNDAIKSFQTIRDEIQHPAVINNIDSYINSLQQVQKANFSLTVGPSYSRNLNQSANSYECLYYNIDDSCYIKRESPAPINANGVNIDLSFNKNFNLLGQHNIELQALYSNSSYHHYKEYANETTKISLGYLYRTRKQSFSLTPLLEYSRLGYDSLYLNYNLGLDYSYNLSENLRLSSNYNYQQKHYYHDRYAQFYNSYSNRVSATLIYSLTNNLVMWLGMEHNNEQAKVNTFSSKQNTARLGLFARINNMLDIRGSYNHKKSNYQDYNAVLEQIRKDQSNSFILQLSPSKLTVIGFKPMLLVVHNRNKSNIDWLYSHKKTEVAMQLQKNF